MPNEFEKTTAFIETAKAVGADLIVPPRLTPEKWQRRMDVLERYYRNPNSTYKSLSALFGGVSGSRIGQLLSRAIEGLYANCPPCIQVAYALKDLKRGKPTSLEDAIERSRLLDGPMEAVVEGISKGLDARTIMVEQKLTSEQLAGLRRRLKKDHRGVHVDVPYVREGCKTNQELRTKLEVEQDPKKIRELLNKVKRRFYEKNIRGENSLLITTKALLQEAGIRYAIWQTPISTFTDVLEKAGIPIGRFEYVIKNGPQAGRQVYMFTSRIYRDHAVSILRNHPDLEKFRTSQ